MDQVNRDQLLIAVLFAFFFHFNMFERPFLVKMGIMGIVLCHAGIEPTGNVVMKKAVFTVETISAGQGEVLVYVEDPAGHREEAKVTANNDKNRTYSVFYVPKVTGQHKVPKSVYSHLKSMKWKA